MSAKIFGHEVQGMRGIIGDAFVSLGNKYDRMLVVDAETNTATNCSVFAKAFPDRFINVGIAEQHALSMAFGLSRSGFTPWVPLFASFIARRAYDQLYIDIGYTHANVKMMGCYAGITSASTGATHQSFNDIALLRSAPGIVIIEPADPTELCEAMHACAEIEGPTYIRMIRADLPQYEDDLPILDRKPFRIGKADVLTEGSDVTIAASGMMVARALEAAELLKAEGISAEVLNMASIEPLDKETLLKSAAKTGRVVTAENHYTVGGLGSAVAEVLSEELPTKMKRVGIGRRYGHCAALPELLEDYGINSKAIMDAVRSLMK